MPAPAGAHSSSFQPMCGTLSPVSSRSTRTGEDPEPGPPAALPAALEQELEAEAHAQERRAGGDALEHGGPEAALLEPRRRVAEGADPGEHHRRGVAHRGGALGDAHVGAAALERLGHAGQIAHAVVDHGDARLRHEPQRRQSVPLVDGTASSRPWRSHAWASARATPLNTASTM